MCHIQSNKSKKLQLGYQENDPNRIEITQVSSQIVACSDLLC